MLCTIWDKRVRNLISRTRIRNTFFLSSLANQILGFCYQQHLIKESIHHFELFAFKYMSQKEIEGFLLAGCGQTSLDMPRFSEMITGALSFTCDFNDNITLG